ncbi:hypothetical protein [Spirosoma sordidisoli]|uniref:DUF723 domain-containing protein n=1 Tax=Spirosoma sordidisoli TaxID=2502893 RepID=A0A4Q2UMY7_9BACT|nr:hypothetical protein [Spirosoma sordidisoli]RYC70676.1 hypothetical protein EQG79_00560 [Spirosoma sordidisoli]
MNKVFRHRIGFTDFVKRSKLVHGDFYGYMEPEGFRMDKNIEIICPLHGSFMQRPQHHVRGVKCPSCAREITNRKPLGAATFIARSKSVHGDLYDYNRVVYVRNDVNVEIVCPIHGVFLQTPDSHLVGRGCNFCSKNQRLSTEQFLERAKKVHGDKYDYSRVDYCSYNVKLTIVCPTHGAWEQLPGNHLRGKGCSFCAKQNVSPKNIRKSAWVSRQKGRRSTLYLIACKTRDTTFQKIGITHNSLKMRFRGAPFLFTKILAITSHDAGLIYDLEKLVARQLRPFRYMPGDRFGGYTECYNFPNTESAVDVIKKTWRTIKQ